MNVPPDLAHLRVISETESLKHHVAREKIERARDEDLIWKAIDRMADVLQTLVLRQTRIERLQWAVLTFGVVSPLAAWLLGSR